MKPIEQIGQIKQKVHGLLKKQVTLEKENEKLKQQISNDVQCGASELEKLKRKNELLSDENRELTSAYNDLNEEYEAHKAEYGSLVTSNRDLTGRIGMLSL